MDSMKQKEFSQKPLSTEVDVDEDWLDMMMVARAIGLSPQEVWTFIHSKFDPATNS